MKIKSKVNTPFGEGVIIGKDSADPALWRWIVKIAGKPKHLKPFGYMQAFFPRELEAFNG